jgi:hypothetical protein
MIPGPVLRRLRTGDVFVPVLGAVKFGIDVVNHPTIIELLMVDELADVEFCVGAGQGDAPIVRGLGFILVKV